MENDRFEYLNTNRLLLRKITPELYQLVFRTLSDSNLMKFFGFSTKEELLNERVKFLKGVATHNKSFLYFQLIEPKSKEIIGWCGFHTWYLDHSRAEIGYGLYSDEFKNTGLMSEAMTKIVEFGFSSMKLNRIEAFISPSNEPSLKLARKFGFKNEGCLKSHYLFNGTFEDSEIFGLLKADYEYAVKNSV